MGCVWSCDDDLSHQERRQRAARNQLRGLPNTVQLQRKPQYGEYRCSCGRFWNSRLSWQHAYQICKRCRNRVYPQNLRDVRPSDMSRAKEDVKEHQREYCQMCQQLGHYCGRSYNITRGRP